MKKAPQKTTLVFARPLRTNWGAEFKDGDSVAAAMDVHPQLTEELVGYFRDAGHVREVPCEEPEAPEAPKKDPAGESEPPAEKSSTGKKGKGKGDRSQPADSQPTE